jgi:hypothetical protein
LLGLVQDLYAADLDNRTFLHTRFGLGQDILEPYKQTVARWLWPDAFAKQDTSVAKARQAISSYKKAVGDPAGLAELMTFYCEQAAGFAADVGYQDDGYFDALVRMFEQAVSAANAAGRQPRRTHCQAGSRPEHKSRVRIWRRRRHGLDPCQAHHAQGLAVGSAHPVK